MKVPASSASVRPGPSVADRLGSPSSQDVVKGGSRSACILYGYAAGCVLLVLVCLGWTIWLMILTVSPTATVNRLMGTGDLDFGSFWRLSDAPKGIVGVGLAGLGCVAMGYGLALWQLFSGTITRNNKRPPAKNDGAKRLSGLAAKVSGYLTVHPTDSKLNERSRSSRFTSALTNSARQLAVGVLDRESRTRRNIHSLIKIADVAIQWLSLAQLMAEGMPVALISLFAATVAINAASAALMFLLPYDNMGRPQLLVDTAFDFAVAVVFPVIVLVYALQSFTFDQELMAINAQVFPTGFFERMSSVIADPVEVANVRRTLDSLRIDSVTKIFTRVGTNAALCRRCFGLLELLRARRSGFSDFPNVYPKRNRALATLCLSMAVAVVVVTTGSINTSSSACEMHPECVQIARRWVFGRLKDDPTRCPCLAMIDRNIAIATYQEWDKPIDRTEKLAHLASSGDLQTLQLVNRVLPTFPEELRKSTRLKHVSLYYTETLVMPEWFSEFVHLEFLHIEGKSPPKSLHSLPDGLFDDMHQLAYLHLGVQALERLPSFDGLVNLKTLTLGLLLMLTELPSFDHLSKLERLTVNAVPYVEVFPDLAHIRNLQALVAFDRGAFCCNGFLGADKCDLNRSLCQQHLLGAPAVTQCLPANRVASPATRAYFDKFELSACHGEALKAGNVKMAPTPPEMVQCNGTLYRACQALGKPAGTPAMCYNARWMPVACDATPFPIQMRRQQIALGHGAPCDPTYEAWLGCN